MHLTSLKRKLNNQNVRSRFAPSPTGYMHLGHVAHCLYLWGITKSLGGCVVFRIEDHDFQRSNLAYADQIIKDLDWLGFKVDEGYQSCESEDYLQSRQAHIYQETLDRLQEEGLVYPCFCSRKHIRERLKSSQQSYDGYCRNKSCSSQKSALRLKVHSHVTMKYLDAMFGEQVCSVNAGPDDIVLRTKEENFSYNFAVVNDDLKHGINLVVRGVDLMPSTGIQLYLRECMSPQKSSLYFAHHPLIYESNSQVKLSKRNKDQSIKSMQASGLEPEHIIGRAAYKCGLVKENKPQELSDILNLFKI